MTAIDVLYEDNHLLVVNKPAGIATMGAESGPTMHTLVANYLKTTYQKPGKAYVGVVSRLDAMTSGVLVFAKTSKAASRLSAQFAERSTGGTEKIYLAGIEGTLSPTSSEWIDHVRKDDAAHRMRVVAPSVSGAKEACLRYHQVAAAPKGSLVAVRLISGRKHQIRLQFAERGHPVIGDRKYGSRRSFPQGIALHSWRLKIIHPTQRVAMWFRADPPATWKAWLSQLPAAQRPRWDAKLDRLLEASFQIHFEEPT